MSHNRYLFTAHESRYILLILCVLVIVVSVLDNAIILSFFVGLLLFALYLFREPNQLEPSHPHEVVSPVQGIVTAIEKKEETRLKHQAIRIQIAMRFTDVYTIYSPVGGKIVERWCTAANPSNKESRYHLDFHIQTDTGANILTIIRFRQLIRHFYLYLTPGERIGSGQRCGYLYFGGLVDVCLPPTSDVQVKIGQRVTPRKTTLAKLIET